jgi:hypothetical protein
MSLTSRLTSWLRRRNRKVKPARNEWGALHPLRKWRSPLYLERLEDRIAPSVTSIFDSSTGKLAVTITPGGVEDVAITTSGANVQINGFNPGTPADPLNPGPGVPSANIKAIAVTGDSLANTIDLSGVHTADFTQLGSVVIDPGAGNNTVTGSDFPDTITRRVVDGTMALTATTLTITSGAGTETDTFSSVERAVLTGKQLTSPNTFAGQVVFSSGAPQWTEQGPGPVNDGYDRLGADKPADRVVSGAVQAIAVDPTHPNIMYVGSPNGGIWKTTDNAATWMPLTDQFRSLSISALAIDPTNSNIIYAGTGSRSSTFEGGLAIGVYKSIDAGATWQLLGQVGADGKLSFDTFKDKVITGIVVKGSTVLVATASSDGVYRSTDSGATFAPVLSAGSPLGSISDMVAEDLAPGNPAGNLRVYVGVPGKGLFMSPDSGATWSDVTNNAATAAGNPGLVTGSARIRLAVS